MLEDIVADAANRILREQGSRVVVGRADGLMKDGARVLLVPSDLVGLSAPAAPPRGGATVAAPWTAGCAAVEVAARAHGASVTPCLTRSSGGALAWGLQLDPIAAPTA